MMHEKAGCVRKSSGRGTGWIVGYNILFFLAAAAAAPLLVALAAASPKRRETARQRLGLGPLPRRLRTTDREGLEKSVWVHALSVGEVLSAVPLVKALGRACGIANIVFSASTLTGFNIAGKRLKNHVRDIIYYPYDWIGSVKRTVGAVNPGLVVIVESDIWPNFLSEMNRRNVPTLLVNARLSPRSFRGYRCLKGFSRWMFSAFSEICTQSATDAGRFRNLGISGTKISVTGNVKFDPEREPEKNRYAAPPDPLGRSLGERPVMVAGSTHDGEEMLLCEAFAALKREFSDLVLIVAPRDPARAGAVCRLFRQAGFAAGVMRHPDGPDTANRSEVLVVDTMGVLARLYGLSDVAFVGGSLVPAGGHNPLEPAAASKPLLFGPDMSDFSEIARWLRSGGGALQVDSARALGEQAAGLFRDPDRRGRMGARAFAVFTAHSGAVERTVNIIRAWLPDGL